MTKSINITVWKIYISKVNQICIVKLFLCMLNRSKRKILHFSKLLFFEFVSLSSFESFIYLYSIEREKEILSRIS